MTGVEFTFSDDMIDRAARSLYEQGFGYDIDADETARRSMRAIVTDALRAAFDGVPASNYSIGALLQFFDLLIGLKAGSGAGGRHEGHGLCGGRQGS